MVIIAAGRGREKELSPICERGQPLLPELWARARVMSRDTAMCKLVVLALAGSCKLHEVRGTPTDRAAPASSRGPCVVVLVSRWSCCQSLLDMGSIHAHETCGDMKAIKLAGNIRVGSGAP